MKDTVFKALKKLNIGGIDDKITLLSSSKEYLSAELKASQTLKKDLAKETEELKCRNKILENKLRDVRELNKRIKENLESTQQKLEESEDMRNESNKIIYNIIDCMLRKIEDIITDEERTEIYKIANNIDKDGEIELGIVKKEIPQYIQLEIKQENNEDSLSHREEIKILEEVEFKNRNDYMKYRKSIEDKVIRYIIKKEPTFFYNKITEIYNKRNDKL